MRNLLRTGAAVLAVAVLSAVACSFPDDTSDQVYVVVYQSDSLLSRGVLGDGEEDFVVAKAYLLVGAPDTGNVDDVELHNIQYLWLSDDNNIVSVEDIQFGAATVQGESPGITTVRAKVLNFEASSEGSTQIRVSGLFALDAVGPATVRYGEQVTFSGVRIGLVFSASLGGADLIPDEFSFLGNPNGLSQISFWVPPPASTDQIFYIGPGFFGFTPNVITVDPVDLYEPNDSDIVDIDINGSGGPRTIQGFNALFYNPALFYEPPVNPWAEEWFRFNRTDTTGAITIIVTSRFVGDTAFTFLSDSVEFTGGGFINLPGTFSLSPDFVLCNGDFFSSSAQRGLVTIHALRDLPQRTLQLFLANAGSGHYEMAVVDGYLTVDRRIGPDRFEEDDLWCKWSDATFNNSNDSMTAARKHIVVGNIFQNGPWFDSTLTIDNPGEADWIRFRIQPQQFADSMTIIRTKALLFPGSFFDPSDIDIYVMRASDFAFMGSSTTAGSSESLLLKLPAGDYYLGVQDVTQQPTKYSVCMAKGTALITCTPPGAAGAAPAPLAASVRRLPVRQPRDPTIPPTRGPVRLP